MQEVQETEQSPSEKRNRIIILILSLVIVGLLGGGGYMYFQSQEKVEVLSSEKEKLEAEMQNLDKDIARMELDLQSADKEKEAMQAELKSLQEKITYYKVQVNRLMQEGKLAQAEREKFQGKYEQLEFYNERYRTKIAELEAQIKVLESENLTLKKNVQSADSMNQQLVQTTSKLQEKVEASMALIASDFDIRGIYRSGKEKESEKGPVLKARKLETLKVCANVNKNPNAEKGSKEVFLIIKAPSGQVLQANDGGKISVDGREMSYSTKMSFNYGGNIMPVCVEFHHEKDYEKGNYTVAMYSRLKQSDKDAYRMGEDVFRLK